MVNRGVMQEAVQQAVTTATPSNDVMGSRFLVPDTRDTRILSVLEKNLSLYCIAETTTDS